MSEDSLIPYYLFNSSRGEGKSLAAYKLAKHLREKRGFYDSYNKLKGGNNSMGDTKSRYEVISELEAKKRDLIMQREGLDDTVKAKKKAITISERELEDEKEELRDFEESLDERKVTINELIKSVDDSLNRFAELNKKS